MLNKIKLVLFSWLHNTSIYKYVMIKIVPYIRFSVYYTSFTGIKYNALAEAMKPGDVILCTDDKKLTTLLVPGEFSHAAMCVSNDGVWETSEMNQYNYDKTTLFDICKTSDRVVLLRPQLPDNVINEAIERCKSFENVNYDITFTLNVSTLYCSELVYMSYTGNSLEVNVTDEVGIGRPYVSPIGLYNANKLKVILDSDAL